MSETKPLTIGQAATLACVLEVTAPKPGNVHRGADFADTTLVDFLASAVAIGPPMDSAADDGIGKTIYSAINATKAVSESNTNLGIVLLLAPLAAAARESRDLDGLRSNVSTLLRKLTPKDADYVYQAICLANPGGLSTTEFDKDLDVRSAAPLDLLEAMRAAASYDLIAQQYVQSFDDVLDFVVPRLCDDRSLSLTSRIVKTYLDTIARYPDSLIRRKCGLEFAESVSRRAAAVIRAGPVDSTPYNEALADFDFWLRSDGNRRNPGTSADLIAAGLFLAIWDGQITPPFN